MQLENWIKQNKLNCTIKRDLVTCDEKTFLYIKPKKGKIFSDIFQLKVTEQEQSTHLQYGIDYYLYEFGEHYYYTQDPHKPTLTPFKYIGQSTEIGFPYLGIHGGYELCNGSRSYDDWCKKARFFQVSQLGICERDTLAGTLAFQLSCVKNDIQPIIGETVTVQTTKDERYTVKLYVVSDEGWNNLLWVNKAINVDNGGQFVDEKTLFERGKGLVCVLNTSLNLTTPLIKKFQLFYDKAYFQIDPVQYRSPQQDKKYLESLKRYVRQFQKEIPAILLCDSYYLDESEAEIKTQLNEIGRVTMDHRSTDQYFKSFEDTSQIIGLFKDEEEGVNFFSKTLENTMSVAELCQFNIPLGELHLPQFVMTESQSMNICKSEVASNEDLFWILIGEGLERITKDMDPQLTIEYEDRIQTEVTVILEGGFVDYFLILWDIIEWCKGQGILTGIGRGSAGGSLIAYLLGITQVDPIEHNLLFERFLNESRIKSSLPDIDLDFQGERRNEVKRYMEQRYGVDYVTSIGTYTTFKVKAAIQDLGRIHNIDAQERNIITKMIEDDDADWTTLFKEASEKSKLKEFLLENYSWISEIPSLRSQPKTASIHAAAVVIVPKTYKGKKRTVYDWMPVKMMDGILVSEWEGPLIEAAGFLKEDILGLRQLDKFADIFELVKKNQGIDLKLSDVKYDEYPVYELFSSGHNQDVFHFGTPGLTIYSQEVKPRVLDDLIAMIAVRRPGAMESRADVSYVNRRDGNEEVIYDRGMEEITRSTYGLYIYQEQVMQACQILGGFSLTEADGVRKAMGKKIIEKMASYEEQFITNAQKRGYSYDEAAEVWATLARFAGYGFNKSHAAAYSMMGYTSQWLKFRFPMEFWTVSLQYAKDEELSKRIHEIHELSREMHISPPEVNSSGTTFFSDFNTNTIYWSLIKISQMGLNRVEEIISERKANGSFFSLEEFKERTKLNKRALLHLILSGCFDKIEKIKNGKERKRLVDDWCELTGSEFPDILDEKKIEKQYYWGLTQKRISGYGRIEYQEIFDLSYIKGPLLPKELNLKSSLGKRGVTAGIVNLIRIKKTRKGEWFAQIELEQNHRAIEVTLWPEIWARYSRMFDKCERKKIAVIYGYVRYDSWRKENGVYALEDSNIEFF